MQKRRASSSAFTFRVLPERLAICRLDAGSPLPRWAQGPFVAAVRTPDELSIVCDASAVPRGVRAVRGRRALGIEGTVAFATVGVIAGLTRPLAEAGISVFVVSTFDTDWILVRDRDLARAVRTLRMTGHAVKTQRADPAVGTPAANVSRRSVSSGRRPIPPRRSERRTGPSDREQRMPGETRAR